MLFAPTTGGPTLYRRLLSPVGSVPMKLVEWWGFVAMFVEQGIKVRVIVRRVCYGKFHFWSVMPYLKTWRCDHIRNWSTAGIEDE